MVRVLLIGVAPEVVDPSDPDVPPDTTPGRIADGVAPRSQTLSHAAGTGNSVRSCLTPALKKRSSTLLPIHGIAS